MEPEKRTEVRSCRYCGADLKFSPCCGRVTGLEQRIADMQIQHSNGFYTPLHEADRKKAHAELALWQEQAERFYKAAKGLSFGTDWNNGTHAKLHGYRQKLLDVVAAYESFKQKAGKP